MTAKVATIGNDHTGANIFRTLPHFTRNPLFSSITAAIRKRRVMFWALVLALASAIFVVAQVFGAEGTADSGGNTPSNTPAPSDQQPQSEHRDETSTSNTTGTSGDSASSTNSTSVTVNGQSIAIPQSSAYDKSVDIPGGSVHVSGSSSQDTSDNAATNSTTTNVKINTDGT